MADQTTPVEAAESPVEAPETGPGPGDTPDIGDQKDDGQVHDNEAARYRRRLREVEAERDGLTERLTAFQRSHAETMAENLGLKAKALWASTDLADLLADDGAVDGVKVYDAVTRAVEELGIQKPMGASRKPKEHLTGGLDPTNSTGPGWADLLRGAK